MDDLVIVKITDPEFLIITKWIMDCHYDRLVSICKEFGHGFQHKFSTGMAYEEHYTIPSKLLTMIILSVNI